MVKQINYKGLFVDVYNDGTIIVDGNKRKHYLNADGYFVCSLNIPNIGYRSVSIHRLIALAFIPNPNNLPEINHLDYNRRNFNISNLEWVSHQDNVRYSICNKPDTNGENNPNYGNKKLSKIYKNNKQYAIEKQGRKGLQNGRCVPIKLYENGILVQEFPYIALCCNYLIKQNITNSSAESVRGQINKCIRNNKLYKNKYSFIKLY